MIIPETLEDSPVKKEEFKAYPWRWLVLFAFCTFTFSNAPGFVEYSPILSLAQEYYGVSSQDVIWFSNCYYITYVFLCPFTIKPLEKRLDISLFAAAFVTALGQWFIYGAHQIYGFALVGFIFLGFGQIFILAAPAFISERWFPVDERNISTSLGSFFNLVGLNFSTLYASIKFQNVTEHQEIIDEIDQMNLMFAIISTIAFVFCITMIRNKPPSPPSISAASDKINILNSFKEALSHLDSVLDLCLFSMFIGASWAYLVVLSILLAPYNYTVEQVGYVSIVYAATGLVAGTIASIYVDYQIRKNTKPQYEYIIKGFLTMAVFGILIKAIIINYVGDTVIIILTAIIGLGLNAFLPLAFQCYIEKLYPTFELVLSTLIMLMSNLFGFILNYILALPEFQFFGLWTILIAISPFYFYLMFFYKSKFLRFEMEQVQQK